MAWCVLLGTLAAFGAVSALWILLGFVLPGGGTVICLCRAEDAPRLRRRCRWLQDLGLIKANVQILPDPRLEEMIQKEWAELDAAGNGDPSGHHQCGGVSEL